MYVYICIYIYIYSVYLLYWCFTGTKDHILTGRKALVALTRCAAARGVQ